MNIELTKHEIFQDIRKKLIEDNFEIITEDQSRPWGGFFVIAEEQAQQFADKYFDGIAADDLRISGKLSPKILIVAPDSRLSWQYHHRRAEIWQVIEGTVGVITSPTDVEGELKTFSPGDRIILNNGERHRLVGLDGWSVLAETAAPLTYRRLNDHLLNTGMQTLPDGSYVPGYGTAFYKNTRTSFAWQPVQLVGATYSF